MANVWVGDNYYIQSIYTQDLTITQNSGAKINSVNYLVNLQRLPENSHVSSTEVFFNSLNDSISSDLSTNDLVAALLPKINTALSADDASSKDDGHSPTSTVGYTQKA